MFERMHSFRLERDKQIFLTRIPLRDGFVGPRVARLAHIWTRAWALGHGTGTHRRTRSRYAGVHLTWHVSMKMPQSGGTAAPRRYHGSPTAHSRSGSGVEDLEKGGQLLTVLTGTAAPRTPPAGPGLGRRSSGCSPAEGQGGASRHSGRDPWPDPCPGDRGGLHRTGLKLLEGESREGGRGGEKPPMSGGL